MLSLDHLSTLLHRALEADRRQAQAQLQEPVALLQATLDSIPDPIYGDERGFLGAQVSTLRSQIEAFAFDEAHNTLRAALAAQAQHGVD